MRSRVMGDRRPLWSLSQGATSSNGNFWIGEVARVPRKELPGVTQCRSFWRAPVLEGAHAIREGRWGPGRTGQGRNIKGGFNGGTAKALQLSKSRANEMLHEAVAACVKAFCRDLPTSARVQTKRRT